MKQSELVVRILEVVRSSEPNVPLSKLIEQLREEEERDAIPEVYSLKIAIKERDEALQALEKVRKERDDARKERDEARKARYEERIRLDDLRNRFNT
jgi:hypothetical protein